MLLLAALVLGSAVLVCVRTYRSGAALDSPGGQLFRIALLAAVLAGPAALSYIAVKSISNPPEWDFLIFWVNGKAAVEQANYYDPALAARFAQPLHPTTSFTSEALPRPFLYPPPTILWFLPLGWFPIRTAAALWYLEQFACLAAAIMLLPRLFLEDRRSIAILLTAALASTMYGTYSNAKTAQTLYLLLLLLTLVYRDRGRFRGGVWLGLGILLKPFAAILLLDALLRRRWSAIAGATVTLAAATLATYAMFGPGVFRSYFALDFTAIPLSIYTEPQNQSLAAWVLRAGIASEPINAVYLAMSGVLCALTLWRAWHSGESAAFALTLAAGVIVYPGSLRSYSVLLLIPVLLMVKEGRAWIVAAVYALMLAGGGNWIFFASALVWTTFAVTGLEPMAKVRTSRSADPSRDRARVEYN